VAVYDGTTVAVVGYDHYNNTGASVISMGTNTIILHTNAAGDQTNNQTGVITFDGTNIIITWTKNNGPTGTYDILWEAM
jgi:hypothetical protein